MVGCSHPWHDTGQTGNGTDNTSLCHCEILLSAVPRTGLCERPPVTKRQSRHGAPSIHCNQSLGWQPCLSHFAEQPCKIFSFNSDLTNNEDSVVTRDGAKHCMDTRGVNS